MFQICLSSDQNDIRVGAVPGPADLPHPLRLRAGSNEDEHAVEAINQLDEIFRRGLLCIEHADRATLRDQARLSIDPAPFGKDAPLGEAIEAGSAPHGIRLEIIVILHDWLSDRPIHGLKNRLVVCDLQHTAEST